MRSSPAAVPRRRTSSISSSSCWGDCVERELLITGMGGQGVQLAAQVIARAATIEGRHVMLFGVYGGAMRGMNTDGTVVVGDAPLQSPPLVSHPGSAAVRRESARAHVA